MEIPLEVIASAVAAVYGGCAAMLGLLWRRYIRVQDRIQRVEASHRQEILAVHARYEARQTELLERYHDLCVGQAGLADTLLDRSRIIEEIVTKRGSRPRREVS